VRPAAGLHSGGFGGNAHNPLNTLAGILGELKGRDGVGTIHGLCGDARTPDAE